MAGIKIDYLKSIPGILKIIEFVILLLAFSCMADCCGNGGGRYAFFLAVTIIGWILVTVLFLFHLLDQTGAIPQLNWKLVVLISSVVLAVLLLICSALMADVSAETQYVKTYYNSFWNKHWTKWWDTMTAGVVFGFIAMIVFIIDAVMHVKGIKAPAAGGGDSTAQKA